MESGNQPFLRSFVQDMRLDPLSELPRSAVWGLMPHHRPADMHNSCARLQELNADFLVGESAFSEDVCMRIGDLPLDL